MVEVETPEAPAVDVDVEAENGKNEDNPSEQIRQEIEHSTHRLIFPETALLIVLMLNTVAKLLFSMMIFLSKVFQVSTTHYDDHPETDYAFDTLSYPQSLTYLTIGLMSFISFMVLMYRRTGKTFVEDGTILYNYRFTNSIQIAAQFILLGSFHFDSNNYTAKNVENWGGRFFAVDFGCYVLLILLEIHANRARKRCLEMEARESTAAEANRSATEVVTDEMKKYDTVKEFFEVMCFC